MTSLAHLLVRDSADGDSPPRWRQGTPERLTPQVVKTLTVRMFDCWKVEQLNATQQIRFRLPTPAPIRLDS